MIALATAKLSFCLFSIRQTRLLRPNYGFRRQLTLFVGWTLSSSGLDASRQVSTPSQQGLARHYHLLEVSPNLGSFHLQIPLQRCKSH